MGPLQIQSRPLMLGVQTDGIVTNVSITLKIMPSMKENCLQYCVELLGEIYPTVLAIFNSMKLIQFIA